MSASTVLGAMLLLAGVGLLGIGVLGWRRRLPRNRVAGVRTPATLRSDAAFAAANRVAAPAVMTAGAICAVAGVLALGAARGSLVVIVTVAGAGAVGLLLAGGLLGHRVAAALPVPARAPAGRASCGGCACGAGGCAATPIDSGAPGATPADAGASDATRAGGRS